ncbi:hypothetical protein [Pendulispora albinea]|uniref:Uncharacterized protein n=1 Tax=Pendulispora albinea TaxID=2741071 RepID=A0ABZ2LK14_9BACT
MLEELTSNREVSKGKTRPSRRKRATKTTVAAPTVFDRLASALQPALDEIDLAWA